MGLDKIIQTLALQHNPDAKPSGQLLFLDELLFPDEDSAVQPCSEPRNDTIDQAAKGEAHKRRAEKEAAEKERAERESAEKEKVNEAERGKKDREQAAKERAEKEQAEKARKEKEKADKEKTAKEKAGKEKAAKERHDRERAEREKEEEAKAEQVAKENWEKKKPCEWEIIPCVRGHHPSVAQPMKPDVVRRIQSKIQMVVQGDPQWRIALRYVLGKIVEEGRDISDMQGYEKLVEFVMGMPH